VARAGWPPRGHAEAGCGEQRPAAASAAAESATFERDADWEAQLAKIKAYKRQHGDCNVPQKWAEDPRLGSWVRRQRNLKKNLDHGEPSGVATAARVAKLDALGFVWELSAAAISKQRSKGNQDAAGWAAQLAKLKTYRSRHGDCNVPQKWAEDPPLGRWVADQRRCKRNLDRGESSKGMTAARATKLDALGFAWELSAAAISKQNSKAARDDAGWEAQLAKLKAYQRRHGDCNVPQGWAEDPGLGNWVDNQRKYKKALDRGEPSHRITAALAAKLKALGFAWKMSVEAISKRNSKANRDDAGWEVNLAKLKEYKRKHDDCNVPRSWAEDPRLGNWVDDQRARKKALDHGEPSPRIMAARAAKLDALGFAWALSAAAISKQNSKANRDDAGWEGWLAKLEAHQRRHGDCNVPQGWAEDPRLGAWVKGQRKSKKALDRGEPSKGMTAARAARLHALGFAWELSAGAARDDAGWEAQLAKLMAYKRRHGDCNVPRGWAEDPPLSGWVDTQRRCKKKLDCGESGQGMMARVAKLEALGFVWSLGR
jgi:hypothetical protein